MTLVAMLFVYNTRDNLLFIYDTRDLFFSYRDSYVLWRNKKHINTFVLRKKKYKSGAMLISCTFHLDIRTHILPSSLDSWPENW